MAQLIGNFHCEILQENKWSRVSPPPEPNTFLNHNPQTCPDGTGAPPPSSSASDICMGVDLRNHRLPREIDLRFAPG